MRISLSLDTLTWVYELPIDFFLSKKNVLKQLFGHIFIQFVFF